MALRHELTWAAELSRSEQLQELWQLVGGHPFLTRIALYHLAIGSVDLACLLAEAATPGGIYGSHLRLLLGALRDQPVLAETVENLTQAPDGLPLEAMVAYQLESLGLVQLAGDRVLLNCQLYRDYFRTQLHGITQAHLAELERQNQSLQQLVNLDNLTQIANRRSFDNYLEQSWREAQRARQPLALILIDIDYFKLYDDAFGRLQGDVCLQKVARCLREAIALPQGLACRYGDEEFAVILPNTSLDTAIGLAETSRERERALGIEHDEEAIGGWPELVLTISAGVAALVPDANRAPRDPVQAADLALYGAKRAGRNCVEVRAVENMSRA